MTEATIMQHVYSLYEGDVDDWTSTSDEYLAARRFANQAVQMWEFYDNTKWRELFGTLTAASDGTKTITANTYSYSTPTNFRFPCSYVRTTVNSNSTYYTVIPPEKVAIYDDETDRFAYFLGNPKDAYKVYFNPELTLTTGDTINYEYYKTATPFTTTTSVTEMSNPMMIVHYILWRMYKNDGEDGRAREEFSVAQQYLEAMRTDNIEGLWNVTSQIDEAPPTTIGFGL